MASSDRVIKLRNSETVKFLELYAGERMLYDFNLDEYKDRELRSEASKRISKAMGIDGFGPREIISKFKNLRSSYCQELKKIAEAERKGSVYKPKVFWFDQMNSFIRPFIQQRGHQNTAQTNLIEDTQSEHSDSPFLQEVEEFEDIICESPITVKTEPTITTLKRKSPSISSIEPLPKIRQVFTESEVDHLMPDAHQKTTDISDNIASTSSEDIYDIFGKYVATMLRSIGPPTALRLQETITSTMINAMCSFQTNCNQSTGATSKGDSNHY
ncbi:uncharacterized protein LOC123316991 isoform X1 [Coccinella septempunctata]|uniref:uncharacterized protein LOC123316991 isoform X1 n=1 Tax=Coccinella septempunctata TaxID=41139 RepID=UPI001D077384|nr:uncharacterized protein LOC123316991 isoform X1 [Coccinella septempunctata]